MSMKSSVMVFLALVGMTAVAKTEVTFYATNIVRVTKTEGRPLVQPIDVVRLKPAADAAARSPLTVEVDAQGVVTFRLKDGTVLLKEDGPSVRNRQWFLFDRHLPMYGFGSIQDDRLNRRMGRTVMCPGNLDDGIPFIQTVKGWGLFWNNTSVTTYDGLEAGFGLSSECCDAIDYFFIYGGMMDGTVAGMRELTGDVPMLPRWSYGFWQSRERYKSQAELLEVVTRYRSLGIPLDGIIQDWRYWGERDSLWNSTEFLNKGFHDPKGMADAVHAAHAHLIISVWPNFGNTTKPYAAFEQAGQLLPGAGFQRTTRVHNVYDLAARATYWDFLSKLWSVGLDGWWMDDTEPEFQMSERDLDRSLGCGTFRELRCAFPYMTVSNVATNTRRVAPDKRVFILTRSAFAGQQSTGAQVWSGDTSSSWETLHKQLPAGLGFSLTGNPNWNCDLGGFFANRSDKDFVERYVRFLQFGTTLPMMRSHGTRFPREFYFFGKAGEPAYDAMVKAVKLRYRLLPYLYSVAWECSRYRSTFMRAMVMDFPEDERTWNDGGTYLCGHALITAPVQIGHPKQMCIYLPKGTDWWNYFTGERVTGGRVVGMPPKLDEFPLYVRAGSIMPYGPDVQWSDEKTLDDLEITVYPGANGSFTLYEDEGDGYGYEQGRYTEIVFRWDEGTKQLTIDNRKGAYPGMLEKRRFRITLFGSGTPEKSVAYDGKTVSVQF
ncbi:MAG: DUF5110 domain-containing protein [Kiritimatiellae bacterium]|nr:DUF5110 domain-containing protein [Kiritimatiellia bacterium]